MTSYLFILSVVWLGFSAVGWYFIVEQVRDGLNPPPIQPLGILIDLLAFPYFIWYLLMWLMGS
jgi:hypothetical protein